MDLGLGFRLPVKGLGEGPNVCGNSVDQALMAKDKNTHVLSWAHGFFGRLGVCSAGCCLLSAFADMCNASAA